jgi:hypothetical protein
VIVRAFLAAWLVATAVPAAEVKIFRLARQQAFLRGELDGIGVDALGTLRLAASAERLAAFAEPFVLAASRGPDGWVVGTGNEGRVMAVAADGTVSELFAVPEPEVFAVLATEDGTVYAAGSPSGAVYRWREGRAEPFFAPGETYVWDLELLPDGRLLVATGTQGRLFVVDAAGSGTVLWDGDDTHVRAVHALADGSVLAGTADEGLVVRISPEGRVRTLHDAAEPEVVDFAAGPDGVVFTAAVASEASQLPATPAKPQASAEQGQQGGGKAEEEAEAGAAVVVVVEETATDTLLGSRPPGYQGPRSNVLRIDATGNVESVARLDEDTVYDLLWADGRLWIGTGVEGKLYTLRDRDLVLENDVDERQIMALVPAGGELPAFATTNAAAFYRLAGGQSRSGSYTSPVLDAQQISRFGTFRWLGEQPPGSQLRFSFRSGLSAEPDRTWSAWTPAEQGREIDLAAVPAARYVQWRLEASASGASPALAAAELSYRQQNLAPRITALEVMDPGQVMVSYTFNPGDQVYEPASPTRDGMFTSLEPSHEEADRRLKTLWKKGYRTVRWTASDPNEDELTYRLDFRPEGEEAWYEVAEEVRDAAHYSFDATVLPDGLYRFRLTAGDRLPGADERLADERVSEPVVVDHSPAVLGRVRREGAELSVVVEDALSPLREAVYSVGAGEWLDAAAADGLLDGMHETLRVPVPAGARLVMLRVTDAAFNTVTFDLAAEER